MRISTRIIVAAALILVAANVKAQTSSEYIKDEAQIIDLREFTASLDWTSADTKFTRGGTPAPDTIRWIDRIYNLPDYMQAFHKRHGELVQQVLDGGTNYLCDPDADRGVNTVHFSDGSTSAILKEVKRKILYTFPVDVNVNDPYAKQQYAAQAVIDDLDANVKPTLLNEVHDFIPYMFMSISYDYPQAFWQGNYWSWGSTYKYTWDFMTTPGKDSVEYTYLVLYNIKTGDFDCRIDKFASPQAVKNGVTEFKTLVNDILKNNPNTTRYAQVQYLNDWLTKHNSYSSAYASGDFSPIVWSPISALRGTTGDEGPVCEGYSRAFKILCDGLNIPCILAVGDAIGSKGATPESHMWNEVKMNDGQWYAVDVTWNDPMVGGGAQAMESGAENENWLLLGKNDVVNEWDGLTFTESHPNSLVYGQGESSAWDYDNETLIADTHFDIANGVESVAQPQNAKVYSILGVYLGSYESVEQALSSLESGIYIINGRKVLVK